MTLAQRALQRLQSWPDLTVGPAGCGIGQALRCSRDEIVHFHSDRDVDLNLTRRIIQRFHYDLGASSALHLLPGSRWVTVHLDCDADVDLLLSLVSIALKAHQTHPVPEPPTGCNHHRVTVLPRDGVPGG
ncbi:MULTISPECIES: luciferase family protein [unclassified Streptomyces]|uniref:luciferase domain-containing protein n=1 Tax=unclassified Streptomyces TaxID=2593676 RepID=UPI0019039247|nr:luciferase family protein [Streptomyces sp. HSG2]